MDEKQKIPGEKIALIEEYLPGENTFEDDDSIRATAVGEIRLDSTERLASIERQKQITSSKSRRYYHRRCRGKFTINDCYND